MRRTLLFIAGVLIAHLSFSQTITTIAGNHTAGYTGTGGPATAAELNNPGDILMDHQGNLIISDYNNNTVRMIDAAGIITTIVGTGTAGYSGDGTAAVTALIYHPCGLALNSTGELYFCDYGNNVIRKVDASGIISTVAGNSMSGYGGDGGPATDARINPTRLAVSGSGNIYIADYQNNRVRKVNTSGIITTVAGIGTMVFSGDGGPATAAGVSVPTSVVVDQFENLYICDQYNQRIRKVNTSGIISTIAGTGVMSYSGDGGPATAATFHYPSNIDVDFKGNIFVADAYNNAVRKIDYDGNISTVAGTGTAGYTGDGGPATAARLNQPWAVTFACQTIFVCDAFNNVVRKIDYLIGMAPIYGDTVVNVGSTITLSVPASGGVWSSSSSSIATVGSSTGVVTGLTPGTDTITFTNICGTSSYVITVLGPTGIQSAGQEATVTISPNPSKGAISVDGSFPGIANSKNGTMEIIDMVGRRVQCEILPISNRAIHRSVILDNSISNGLYIIRIRTDDMNKSVQFRLDR